MHSTFYVRFIVDLCVCFGYGVLLGCMIFLGAAVCTAQKNICMDERVPKKEKERAMNCHSSVILDNRLDEKWEHFEHKFMWAIQVK